ncbi:MAG TPA: ferredoxin--NADP reductase [Acidimicrobiales bacterium]|jgi:3-ketosteroid 9alpha-monooxygenase subunit B|nr:ferredoxin--NADP reductase [Acidimicrobiales bacterium]
MTDHTSVLYAHGYHKLRIKGVVRETHDASSFVLDVPDDLAATFRYRPGQFCTFRVPVDGVEHVRSYSMSSAPEIDADLVVTVKRVAGGLVSNWFLDHVAVGDVVEVTKPAGVFCPQEAVDRPVLGFCGGSGVTPVMSITKHVLAQTRRSVRLLYANRDRESVIFDAAFSALGDEHPERLDVRRHLDDAGGFLTAEAIKAFVGTDAGNADCYVCGPGPFMDLVESALVELGVTAGHIFIERFLVEEQEKEAAAVETGASGPESEVPEEVTVLLGGKKAVVKYQPGDTLLETARRGGLRPPFSCESGNCATCMAFLKEGSVRMRANNALTSEEVEEGWVLTCQSLPSGETVVVEYEAM